MTTTAATSSRPAVPSFTPGLVTSLQAVEAYPAVSLLMSTTPAPKMLAADVARLAGVGVFVSAAFCTVVRLPVPVSDRVVIDPTFATRDLVLALHRTPRHVVLALSPHEAPGRPQQGRPHPSALTAPV